MPGSRYSFLDLTVLAELRRRVLAPEATILFDADMHAVLWANAPGAALFGGTDLAEIIGIPLSPSQPFVRQLRDAVSQIENNEPMVRGFRVARGLRTEFIQCELSFVRLPAGEQAVLLVTTEDRFARATREHELAANAVDSFTGLASAAAIVDDYGLAIAASDSFANIDLSPEDISVLIDEVAEESDRLLKRVVDLGDGEAIAVGVARLRERPGRYLLVCAEASEVDEETETATAPEDSDAEPTAFVAPLETTPVVTEAPYEAVDLTAEETTDLSEERHPALEAEPVAFGGEKRELAPPPGWEIEERDAEPVAFDGERRELVPPEGWEDDDFDDEILEDGDAANDEAESPNEADEDAIVTEETAAEETRAAEPMQRLRMPSLLDRWYLGLRGGSAVEETPEPARAAPESDEAPDEQVDTAEDKVSTEEISSAEVSGDDIHAQEPVVEREPEETTAEIDAALNEEDESIGEDRETHDDESDLDEVVTAEESHPEVAATTVAEEPAEDRTAEAEDEGFVFARDGDPVRFAWIIDTDQEFRSVSPELAQTVGPNAADIVGRKWGEVAAVFGFDNSGEIRRLLERRDTWSGKSVMWPVQGTDLVVPIDLAALPAFDAQRRFDGFRGFGIIRVSDSVIDPNETGLALMPVQAPKSHADDQAETATTEAPDAESEQIEERRIAGRSEEAVEAGSMAANVVQLRSPARSDAQDELSRRESQAFSEIGRTLRNGEEAPRSEREDYRRAVEEASEETSRDDNAGTETPDTRDTDEVEAKEMDREGFGTTEGHEESRYAAHGEDDAAPEAAASEDHDGDERAEAYSPLPIGGVAERRRGTNAILEQLPVPVLIYRNGVTLFANPELLELTGYETVDELSAAGGVDALLSGEPAEGRATLICKDGRRMNISPLLQTVPWSDAEGDAGKALLLSFRPTTGGTESLPEDEKIALDMVRVAELQNILDTATDGIVIADRDGTIESINASAEALFGIDLDQATGKPLTDLFAQESHKALADYMAELAQPGVTFMLHDGREVIGKEAKGGLIPLYITIGPVGAAEKFCLVLRDMTHWKKAEEELVNAKRAAELASEQKTDFLARVSHEIRTPLNAIIGFSDVMLEERFGPIGNERYREYLRDINRSGVHVLDLINDLLDISKIEAGKMELSYEAVDLNQLAAETVALLQPQANRDRIIIRTSLSRAVPRVVADARSIRQIILNLVSNAIKFTPENGQVIVSTVYEGNGEVALRVRDTGKGMSASEIDNAMKPFQQLSGVDERRGQGTGLGLPLTKALVEANRAYFDLESTPGEGTIAHVHFPTQRVLAD